MRAARLVLLFALISVGLAVVSAILFKDLGLALAFALVGLLAGAVVGALIGHAQQMNRIEQRLAAIERRGQEAEKP
jgi:hypothetical protein